MKPTRPWKPLCFLLLLAVPVAAIVFACGVETFLRAADRP